MLTVGYLVLLLVVLMALALGVRRLHRPRWAAASAVAAGPWCAKCGYEIRVPGTVACPECGSELLASEGLRLMPPGSRWYLWGLVPVIVMVTLAAWEGGVWLAVPEMVHFHVSERWEGPASGTYNHILMSGWSLPASCYRWQKPAEPRELPFFVAHLVDAPKRVPYLKVEPSLTWEAHDDQVQLRGDELNPEAVLSWFDAAGIDTTDDAVQAEGEWLAERMVLRVQGRSVKHPPAGLFQNDDVQAGTRWGNRDGYIMTGLGRLVTLPFYIVMMVLLIKLAARWPMRWTRLDPAVSIDAKRRRLLYVPTNCADSAT